MFQLIRRLSLQRVNVSSLRSEDDFGCTRQSAVIRLDITFATLRISMDLTIVLVVASVVAVHWGRIADFSV